MLEKNDIKNILVVILVLVIMFGIVIFSRINNNDKKDENVPNNDSSEIIDSIEEKQEEVEENPGQSEDVSISNSVSNEVVVSTPKEEQEEVEENKYPEINFEQTYYTVSLGSEFILPEITALDDSGNTLKVNITYEFMPLDSSEYVNVLEFSTNKLGIYKITYYVENENHYVSTQDIYVEIIDQEAPNVEAIITNYDYVTDVYEYIPVMNNSIINQSIDISFIDNDMVSYAEYYNALVDNTITGDTLEQEAMPTVVPIDVNSILTLSEEGEYHIRVYDRSDNTFEYVVTIDLTLPTLNVNYSQVSDDLILVTVTSTEEMKNIEGWFLSSDKKELTKVYSNNVLEDCIFEDLAGNRSLISLNYKGLNIEVKQNDIVTQSRNLNQNDGEIKLIVESEELYQITYTIDDGVSNTYTSGDILTTDGYYQFTITNGDYTTSLELYISSMDISD